MPDPGSTRFGLAWYRLRSGAWVQAPADDPRWRDGPTRQRRRKTPREDPDDGR